MCSCQVFLSFEMGSHSFRITCLFGRLFGIMCDVALAKLLLHES